MTRDITIIKKTLMVVLMIAFGTTVSWGQTPDFSGIWYIANETNHGNDKTSTHWYLVPGADPQQPHYADAYFHNEFCNKTGSGDYTGDNYGDPGKPFLTTYQTNRDLNSVWIIVPTGDGYYNIIHAKTGKYVVYEPPYQEAIHRKSVHLESTTAPGDNAKFKLTGSSPSGPININPKSVTSGNMYFNPAVGVGNRLQYYGTGDDYFHEGMIGLYSGNTDKSQWYLEDASSSTSLTPVISDADETNNTFTITSPAAVFSTIRYTTDGSTTPNASTGTTAVSGSDISIVGSWSVQAVGVFGTFITPVAGPKTVAPVYCKTPVFTYSTETGKVTITSGTSNASIYYTLDEATPTSGSTPYEGPFEVANLTTIKAIAIKTGLLDSEIASSKLVLNPTITLAENEYTYSGSAKEPVVSSVKDGETMISSDEYTIDYQNNVDAGDAAVLINNKAGGNYIVYGSTTFTINPKTVTITANDASKTYDGTVLTENGFTSTALETSDTHIFTVAMTAESTITNVGTQPNVIETVDGVAVATGTETAVGNYLVTTANGTLIIAPKSIGDGNKPVDGIVIVLSETGVVSEVTDGGVAMEEDKDYTYTTETVNSDIIVTVTGKGNYTGFAKALYACPAFIDADGEGAGQAAAAYQASSDLSTPTGVKAYIVRKVNPTIGTITVSEVAYIPKDVPVLLLSDAERGGFVASPKEEATASITAETANGNQLKMAPTGGVTVKAAEVYMFYLGEFVLAKAGTVKAGRFYLYNPNYVNTPDNQGSSGAREFLQIVVEEPTGINDALHLMNNDQLLMDNWYDLQGRRIDSHKLPKGLYIHNGRKVVVK